MNDSLNAAAAQTSQPVRRDRWGRYQVLPVGGNKPVGYTRATTIAKTLDDTTNLGAWGKRMTAIGLAARPDLLALVQGAEDNRALNGICERAAEAGGSTVRRDLGTAIHSFFEQSCLDAAYVPPAAYAADIAAIHGTIRAAGYKVVEDCSEIMVVVDEHKIAGTADLILERISDGELFIADLKTGSSLAYGALGFAVQLAIYSHADNIYFQGAESDGTSDLRVDMPAVSREIAIILHCEPGSGVCEAHELDLGAGWDALQTALKVREWRNKRKLLVRLDLGGGGAGSAVVASTGGPPATHPQPEPPEPVASAEEDHMILQRTLWALERIRLLGEAGHIELVQGGWPAGVPGPKSVRQQETAWTAANLAAITAVLDRVEAVTEMPFGATDPALLRAEQIAETQTLLKHLTGAEPRRK